MIEIRLADLNTTMARIRHIPYAMQRAVMPAVTDMLDQVRNKVANVLDADVPLSAKATAKAIKKSGITVSGGSISGQVIIRSGLLPLIDYEVRPQTMTARKGSRPSAWPDFTYALRIGDRRTGRSLSRPSGCSAPFIARMPTGHLGIYFRKPDGKLKEKLGPTVQYHIANPSVINGIEAEAEAAFPTILTRHFERVLAEYGGAK